MPRKYLTQEDFQKFLNNDFYHLKIKVIATIWLCSAILATLIGTLLIRFFWG